VLPKKNRLKKQKDFKRVLKKGKSQRGNLLTIKQTENELAYSRFGFIVGLKVSKKSPQRNKIKRRLREIIKDNLNRIEKGKDVVFMPFPKIKDQSFSRIKSETEKLLKKLDLL